MKQSKRFLSVLLAMMLILSTFTIAASAYKTDYSEPAGYDSILTPYFTNDQAASALLDYLDDEVLAPMDVHESYVGIDINIYSLDSVCDTVKEVLTNGLVKTLSGAIGDLGDLTLGMMNNSNNRRRSASVSDFQFFMLLCGWVKANADPVYKIVDNSIDLGIIGWFLDLGEKLPLLNNLHGYVCDLIYKLLLNDGEDTGYQEGAADSYNLDNILQTFLNDHCIKFIFDLLDKETVATVAEYLNIPLNDEGEVAEDMGLLDLLPSLTAAKINIKTASTYDMLINIVNALVDDIVIPFAGGLILELLEIAPEDPEADTSYIDIAINLFVDVPTLIEAGVLDDDVDPSSVNVVEEFLRWKGVENPDHPKPIDKINVGLEYIIKVGIKKFIHFVGTPGYDSHLQLTEYFDGLLTDLIRMVLPMLPSLSSDFAPLTAEQEAAVETMENDELYAFAVKLLLSTFVEGVYFPDDCTTIKELATYTLINVSEEIVHNENVDFQKRVDKFRAMHGAEIKDLPSAATAADVQALLNNQSIVAMDPNSMDTVLEITAAVLNYYLVGETTYVSSNLNPSFDGLLNGCFETFLGKYASLFSIPYTGSNVPSDARTNAWYKLYMSANQWIPISNIFYGCSDSYRGLQSLFMDDIIGNVLNFDINGILGIIGRRPDSDLTKPFSQLVCNLLARIINGVFQLPAEGVNQSTNTYQLNQLIIPYDYTTLDQFVTVSIGSSTVGYKASINGCGLKNTVKQLLLKLENITKEGAVASTALDIIAELIGIIDLDEYEYQKVQFNKTSGLTYTIDDLRALYNNVKFADNEGIKYYEDDYTFFHMVDYDPWTYQDFKSALGKARSLIDQYDDPYSDEPTFTDITYTYYLLQHTHDDWFLNNRPAANDFYLDRVLDKYPEVTQNVDGNGDQLYTNRTWDAYRKAYDFAKLVSREFASYERDGRTGDYHQSKINTARRELLDAIKNLKLNAGVGDADYSRLLAAINGLANQDSPSLFKKRAVDAVVEAYNEALAFYREVWYDADSQIIVDGVTDRLNKAYSLLFTDHLPTLEYEDETYICFKTDEARSYIYGFDGELFSAQDSEDLGGDFNAYISWYLGGHVAYGCSDANLVSAQNGHGTGSKIQLRSDDDGDGNFSVEREYTVIYFGDVNGDTKIDGMDAAVLRTYASRLQKVTPGTSYITFAGDVDFDDTLTITDAKQIEKVGVFKEEIDQCPVQRASQMIAFTDLVNQ